MKIIKRVLLALASVLALGIAALVVKFYVLSPKMRPCVDAKAPATPEAIARGKYLANHVMVCVGCHSPTELDKPGQPMVADQIGAGREFEADHGFPGAIRPANITPDPETGIGNISDGQLLRAMREGISHDGRALFPMMPYVPFSETMTDDDGLAIIAYLRTLKPIRNALEPSRIDFPVSMFIRAVPKPLDHLPASEPTEPLARGQWILRAASCAECHTTTDDHHEPLPGHYLAGGNAFPVGAKGVVYTRNLTSDKATGLGSWTDEEITRAITSGMNKEGRMMYAMPWSFYGGMTDDDKKSLILALRQVPAVSNTVKPVELKD